MWAGGPEAGRMHSECLETKDDGMILWSPLCVGTSHGFLSFTTQVHTENISKKKKKKALFTEKWFQLHNFSVFSKNDKDAFIFYKE